MVTHGHPMNIGLFSAYKLGRHDTRRKTTPQPRPHVQMILVSDYSVVDFPLNPAGMLCLSAPFFYVQQGDRSLTYVS